MMKMSSTLKRYHRLSFPPFMRFPALLLAYAAAAVSVSAQAEAPFVIKFSHMAASDTPKGRAAERFKELAERATKGRVVVEVYPNGQLYKGKEELEALQLGAAQMLAPSLAKFAQLGVREFEIFQLPFLFASLEAVHRITEGPIGNGLLKKLEVKGITGLAYWDNGFKVMSSDDRPLRMPIDFRGQRMRIQPSKVLETQMRALGAIPQAIGFGDVYQALRSGAADGTETAPSIFHAQKMQEVQAHLTVSNHGYLGYAVIANKKFWDGLPAGIRGDLESALKEATRYANANAQKENDQAMELIKNNGKTSVYYLNDIEKDEWRKALMPVQPQTEARIGRALLNAVNREVATAGYPDHVDPSK
jgi:C4-dicarboxylate-binding protein DctP